MGAYLRCLRYCLTKYCGTAEDVVLRLALGESLFLALAQLDWLLCSEGHCREKRDRLPAVTRTSRCIARARPRGTQIVLTWSFVLNLHGLQAGRTNYSDSVGRVGQINTRKRPWRAKNDCLHFFKESSPPLRRTLCSARGLATARLQSPTDPGRPLRRVTNVWQNIEALN